MTMILAAVGEIWNRLDPTEPTPLDLAKFRGVAVVMFAVALAIGS